MDPDPQAAGLLLVTRLNQKRFGATCLGHGHLGGIAGEHAHVLRSPGEGVVVARVIGRCREVVGRVDVQDAAIAELPHRPVFIPDRRIRRQDLLLILTGEIEQGDPLHFSVLELLRIEELGQSLTGVAARFLGGDPPETGIDDVLAGLSGEGTAEGAVENIRGRIVGARDDDVVKDKGQQRHQGREHQGGDHHPPGLHTDAAQGGQFATA